MPSVGDVLAGRYRIDARLGAGGMATVWRARDLRLERDVAVKVLLPNLAGDPVLAARFEREARALAAVADPRVVGIHDVVEGAPGSEPFLVMELCPDGSLGDRLAGGGAGDGRRPGDGSGEDHRAGDTRADGRLVDGHALPPDEALPILADAAAGVAALHAAGIVHRDVTPRNVLLAGGRARVGDLGLARAGVQGETPPGAGLTATGTAVGTLAYLAPEVLEGRPATQASDVYALGAVAYRTLTGVLPHPAGTIAEVVTSREEAVTPLAQMAPGTPPAVAELVDRALATDPALRPTAADLAKALAEAGPTRATGAGVGSRATVAPEAKVAPAAKQEGAGESTVVVALPTAAIASTVPRPPQTAPAQPPAASSTAATASSLATASPSPGATPPPIAGLEARRSHGRHPLPAPGPRYHGPGLWSGELVAVVVIALAIVLLVILLGGRPLGWLGSSAGPTGSPTQPAGAVLASSPSPTPSPAPTPEPTPSPSPTPVPTPTLAPTPTVDPFDAAIALVGPVRSAIDAAKGPDGLKGKEAKTLDDALASVSGALAKRDAAKASDAAARLDDRVRAALQSGAVSGDPAARLTSTVADLVAAVDLLP